MSTSANTVIGALLMISLLSCNAPQTGGDRSKKIREIEWENSQKKKDDNGWTARVESEPGSEGGHYKIVVTGTVVVDQSESALSLRRDPGQALVPDQLILELSGKPVQKGKTETVRYEEHLQRPDQYKRVNIIHGDKLVMVIQSVEIPE